MKITIGEWKTEGGYKAVVAAHNPEAPHCRMFIGWVDGNVCSWNECGGVGNGFGPDSIVAPWTDPVPWDWSTTPPWINWIAMNDRGQWWASSGEPVMDGGTYWPTGSNSYIIPEKYAPKWSGDWKLSKTMRPGYKEVK